MITSFSNPQIKLIRKLRDKKYRSETGLFFVEGAKLVGVCLEEKWNMETIVFSAELVKANFGKKIVEDAGKQSIPLLEVSQEVFQSISTKDGPQGIGAIVVQKTMQLDIVRPSKNDIWIALDEIQDPGNLGTILRTSDSVGAYGVILLDHSTDPFDPEVVRASMGAVFSQKLIKASFSDFELWSKNKQMAVIGTSGNAKKDYHLFEYPDPMVLLMGSERQGLSEAHYRLCQEVVRIPMVGRSDSLNLAIATGVVLYEIFKQRETGLK